MTTKVLDSRELPDLISPGKAARVLTAGGMPTHAQAVRGWADKGRVWSTRTPSGRILVRSAEIQKILKGVKTA